MVVFHRTWILVLSSLIHITTSYQLFPNDKSLVYDWEVKFNTGAMLPSKMISEWHMKAKVIIRKSNQLTQMQIVNVSGSHNINDSTLLNKPFRVNYTSGYIKDLFIEPDDLPWSANMKRALASIYQVNIDLLKNKDLVSSSKEETIYGVCDIDYVIQASDEEKLSLHKTVNLQSCVNLPTNHWENSPRYDCPSSFIDGSISLSERTMNFSVREPLMIQNIVGSGVIEFQPFQAQAEVHHIYIKQFLTLEDSNSDIKIDSTVSPIENSIRTNILYEYLSDVDPIYGYKPSGDGILIEKVQTLLSEIGESLEWEIGIKGLDNETALQILDLMWWLDTPEWEILYENITLGTSYSQETIQHLFWELLPQIGSDSSVLFIKDLIQTAKVKGFMASRLLSTFPFYLRHPSENLLIQCEGLLQLDHKEIEEDTKDTAILSFATLIHKTCAVHCKMDVIDKYTKLFLDRLTETNDYNHQMLYVHAISNMKLPKVLQFFAPQIANTSLTRHYRLLLLWSTMSAIDRSPDKAKEIFWPILLNETESLELRALSILVLLTSSPTTARLNAIHSVMRKEKSQQLYNFYYTTLQSLAKTMMPCYSQINKVVSYFVRFVPPRSHHWATGNYLLDYEDSVRGYGGLLHLLLLASEKTGLPNIIHFSAEQHSLGVTSSRTIYLKLEGLNKFWWDKVMGHLEKFKTAEPRLKDFIKNLNLTHPNGIHEEVHVEYFIKQDNHVIYCDYLNATSLNKIITDLKKMSSIYLEFSVNYQSLQYPQRIITTQPTDIGTPALLTVTTSALLSARGSVQQKNDDDYIEKLLPRTLRNIELDLRYSINSITSLRTYNPLTNIWHGADRSRSLHARIPISTQLLLHYFKSYYKVTSKRHRYFKAGSRLGLVWHSTTHVVPNGLPTVENHKTEDDWSVESKDLGARLGTLVFDCQDDARIADSLVIVKQAFQTHNKNYVMVIGGVPIIGLFSLMNYFTFLPPGGSCGVVLSLSPLASVEQSILVEGSTVSVSMNQNNATVWDLTSALRRLKDGDKEVTFKLRHSHKELSIPTVNNTWRLIRLEGSLLIPSRKAGILKPPNTVHGQALISWGVPESPASMEFTIASESKAEWPENCKDNIPQCLQSVNDLSTKQKATLQYSNLPQWLKLAVRSIFSDFVKTEGNSTVMQFSFPSKVPWTTKGVCAVNKNSILNLDGAIVSSYKLESKCFTILLADCSMNANFVVGIRKNANFDSLMDLKIIHGFDTLNNLTLYANSTLSINGSPTIIPLDDYVTFPVNAKDNDKIFNYKMWKNTMIEIDMGKSGITIQYYAHSVAVLVAGTLKGATCGICGDFNGEVSNEVNGDLKCIDL